MVTTCSVDHAWPYIMRTRPDRNRAALVLGAHPWRFGRVGQNKRETVLEVAMNSVPIFPTLLACLAAFVGCSRNHGGTPKEAPMVIFRGADGRTLSREELLRATGTFRYEIVGGTDVPAEADLLHKQARQVGEAGDHKKALALLERASNLATQLQYSLYEHDNT